MQNARYTIHEVRDIDAPADAVWQRISKHAETSTWVRGASVQLLSPGAADVNGAGAIRQVSFPAQPRWPAITERITAFSAPSTFSYTIVTGAMPGLVDHLGTLTVERLADHRSRLTWHIIFDFRWWHPSRLIAPSFIRTFGKVISGALAELAGQMTSSAGSAAV